MLQLQILHATAKIKDLYAATKTQCNQINIQEKNMCVSIYTHTYIKANPEDHSH